MKVAVLNYSEMYNLACHKIASYHEQLGDQVVMAAGADLFCLDCEKAYLSALFTHDLPNLVRDANLLAARGIEVEIGGPAVTFLADWVEGECGIRPRVGLDERFEKVPGSYLWTFSSRGCPRSCPFCLVSALEGTKVTEDEEFIPAPNLGDSNLLMTSWRHQEKVVEKLKPLGLVDINSGFDCRIFAQDCQLYYGLYSQLNLKMWRFAFDTAVQESHIRNVFQFLKGHGLDRHQVQAYVLCNFPGVSPEEVVYRAKVIMGYGMMPYLMRYQPVDSVERHYVAPGWSEELINSLIAYYNYPPVWMSCSWEERLRSRGKNGLGLVGHAG
jgi:hypothetical protein